MSKKKQQAEQGLAEVGELLETLGANEAESEVEAEAQEEHEDSAPSESQSEAQAAPDAALDAVAESYADLVAAEPVLVGVLEYAAQHVAGYRPDWGHSIAAYAASIGMPMAAPEPTVVMFLRRWGATL